MIPGEGKFPWDFKSEWKLREEGLQETMLAPESLTDGTEIEAQLYNFDFP